MAKMARLIRAALRLLLLNKTARFALIAGLIKLGRYILRPSTISRIKWSSQGLGKKMAASGRSGLFSSLLRGAEELLLLMLSGKGSLSRAGILSALAAVLLSMSREQREGRSDDGKAEDEEAIDLDDYTILEDNH
ncbi:MAG: hypothetical protein KBA97_06575 [Methanothrix sp.]|nr:hypothetical protein [Methanothrix sp.]